MELLDDVLAVVETGSRPKGGSDKGTVGLPSLGGENLRLDGTLDLRAIRRIPRDFFSTMRTGHLRPSDVLINKDGAQTGKVGKYDGEFDEAAINEHLFLLRGSSNIRQDYLFHVLLADETQRQIRVLVTGSAQPGLNRRFLKKIRLPLPALEEQRRIAEILDTVDNTIQSTDRIIAKLELTRVGLRERACTPLGPSDQITRLAELVEAIVDCPHSTPRYRNSGILVARTMHIKNGRFLESDASRVSEDTYCQRVARMVPSAGDVILTREAPVGEAFTIPDSMQICLGQRVVLIRPGQNLLGQYLVELIYSSQGRRQIRRIVAGTTNPHLNVDEIHHMAFFVPSLDEQRSALCSLDAVSARIDAEMAKLRKLHRTRSGLAFDLLSGRVRTIET